MGPSIPPLMENSILVTLMQIILPHFLIFHSTLFDPYATAYSSVFIKNSFKDLFN